MIVRRSPERSGWIASFASFALAVGIAGSAIATQKIVGDEPPNANAAVVPLLIDLEGGDMTARLAAVMAMRELGAVAWPAVPALTRALSDPIVGIRKAAAGALGGIGEAAVSAVPELARALGDPHRFVRSWAAMALFEIGPAAKPAAADLIRMLETDAANLRGRAWCASALPEIHADVDLAVPALVRALSEDPSEEVRSVAVLSLESYGAEAARRGATEYLIDALRDPHWKVRGNAACALMAMGADAQRAVSPLEGALRDDTTYVRDCATRALAELASRD
jgi:HEAT repeat protein